MIIKKMTTGFVIQTFKGNKFVGQKFISTNEPVEYQDREGEPIPGNDTLSRLHHPFDMVQPTEKEIESIIFS